METTIQGLGFSGIACLLHPTPTVILLASVRAREGLLDPTP